MSDEEITILLPVRDQRRRFFEAAVKSVLDQSSPRWRLLAGLDQSPDWIAERLAGPADPRIEVVECRRPGLGGALNTLMERATTPFVCVLLSDDMLVPRAIETVLQHRKAHPEVDYFYSSRRYVDPKGEAIGPVLRARKSFTVDHFANVGSPVKHLMCWRRSLALEIGGMSEHLSAHGCDDYDFPWKMAEAGARFRAIDECLYLYRVHTLGPRLTTDTPVQTQVETLERMFRDHGVDEARLCMYLDRAVDTYLLRAAAGTESTDRSPVPALRARAATEEALYGFQTRGFSRRHFFPHRLLVLHRPGPDGMIYAHRMCGVREPGALSQLLLYALPPVVDEFPDDLFFDDDVVWHRQQLGRRGQIAHADLVQRDDSLFVTLAQSDLVQRIGRRRDLKTRVDTAFKGWEHLLWNGALNLARDRGCRWVWWPTSDLVLAHCDETRPVDPTLFRRIYDQMPNRRAPTERVSDWWRVGVAAAADRIVPLARTLSAPKRARTVCISHDVERGLGHIEAEPEFVAEAERVAPGALDEMLAIEAELGVRATYNVVGQLLHELREKIESDGHALAFHSFDHVLPPSRRGPLGMWREPLRRLRQWGSGTRHRGPFDEESQPARCRDVDYRLKGYRAPQSRITPDLSDAALLRFNFEWFASSSHSLGIDAPRFQNGIVKIPIHLDDFDLHTGRVDYDSWERDLLRRAESADFVAVGLHDCYGPHWLPRYRGLLERLGELACLSTFDEVMNETALGATRWR